VAGTGQGFVLDVTGSRPLLRFDRSTEIWVLRPAPAPRGDIVYRNDNGDQVLRVTADGGMTLYTTAAPQGSPVSPSGEAAPLLAPALTASSCGTTSSARATGPAAPWADWWSSTWTFSRARKPWPPTPCRPPWTPSCAWPDHRPCAARRTRSAASRSSIRGRGPQATFSRGVLRIVIMPRAGVAGRPSSALIVRVVADDVLSR
jgi:hypothetical protein